METIIKELRATLEQYNRGYIDLTDEEVKHITSEIERIQLLLDNC